MAQREIIEKIAAYSSGNSATTIEDFYELQSLLSYGDIKTNKLVAPIAKEEVTKTVTMKQASESDSNRIAGLFSNELRHLRDDPGFTGKSGQVEYLKEILAADKLITKPF